MNRPFARRAVWRCLLIPVFSLVWHLPGFSQSPDSGQLKFDVVTIKQNQSGSTIMRIETHANSYIATNISVAQFIQAAYGTKTDLVIGLPHWTESATYDIQAKMSDFPDTVPTDSPPQAITQQRMLRNILASRFGLRVHTETRTLPLYDLELAGPVTKVQAVPPDAPLMKDSAGADVPRGGLRVRWRELIGSAISMSKLTDELAMQVHKEVIDTTGLIGLYNIHLIWTGESSSTEEKPQDIFTALQEQLGLKLVSSKGPVQVLVVDWIEQPTAN